jgi:hypothetical protein
MHIHFWHRVGAKKGKLMSNYVKMLAISASMMVASQVAMAQSAVPVANMPKQCQELARKGFTIQSENITRSGTGATTPRAGSWAAPRKYGEVGANKWFIDSFPAHPKGGCRVCGVNVGVKGVVGATSQNNDGIGVVGSNTTAPQVSATPAPPHFNTVHARLGGAGPLAQGPYSNLIQINGPDYMNWYMNSLAPSLDVMVQDDSSVTMIEVTYFYY